MDPISLGLLMAIGAGGMAAAVRIRKRREEGRDAPPKPAPAPRAEPRREADPNALKVGDVLLWMGEEFWLSG